MKRIAILGGGISGLSAAVTLENARAAGAALEYVVFESAPRLGGVLVTARVDGCLVEAGPDSFLTEKSWGLDFVRSLGLGDQLIGSNDADRKTYILVKGRLVPIPDGLQFMVPTKIAPILTTPLFSLGAKLHFAREYFQTPNSGGDTQDETVAEMVERHFGPEMVDHLADPLLAGVYGGSASELSAAAVLPRFVEMEKRYGSLSRAMLAARKKMAQTERTGGRKLAPPPRPLFTSLKDGMQQLVDAIVPRLAPETARTGNKIVALNRSGEKWMVRPEQGSPEEFDAVIVALPAGIAGQLLESVNPKLAAELREIPYSSSMTVTMGYDMRDLASLPPGFGFLVPRSEGRRMLACTFVHVKFPHRAPPDRGILRCFLGGSRDDAVLGLSDDEVLSLVRKDLGEILRLKAEPRFTRVYRWRSAMAQYVRGHLARVQRILELKNQLGGFALAGNAYQGIGVPDCILSGQYAAKEVLVKCGLMEAELRIGKSSPGGD
ncbi:MAG: protoporphyrinogen oxidase [Terriglobales bacterium]